MFEDCLVLDWDLALNKSMWLTGLALAKDNLSFYRDNLKGFTAVLTNTSV